MYPCKEVPLASEMNQERYSFSCSHCVNLQYDFETWTYGKKLLPSFSFVFYHLSGIPTVIYTSVNLFLTFRDCVVLWYLPVSLYCLLDFQDVFAILSLISICRHEQTQYDQNTLPHRIHYLYCLELPYIWLSVNFFSSTIFGWYLTHRFIASSWVNLLNFPCSCFGIRNVFFTIVEFVMTGW